MAESREGAIPILQPLYAASGFAWPNFANPNEDRRKRSFRMLVGDIAERLDSNDITKINWQVDVPTPLREKPALAVLEHLHKRRIFTEYEVRPLAQLLKDIHREDLTVMVDGYREEFGRHYSVPTSGHNMRETAEDRRANTFSVNHASTASARSPLQNHSIPTPVTATTEAQQESKALLLNNETEDLSHISSTRPQSALALSLDPSMTKQHVLQRQTVSLESCNTRRQFCSPPVGEKYPTSESTPQSHCCYKHPTPTHENSYVYRQSLSDQKRKVSEISIPATQFEASSTSGSICEISSLHPSGPMWHFQSDQSSGNVSQENILNNSSSSSCVDVGESTHHKASPYSCNFNVGKLASQKQWYESNTSLPVEQYSGAPNGSNNFSTFHPSNPGKRGGHPMFRSMSHEYYHQPTPLCNHGHRHSLVPAERTCRAKCYGSFGRFPVHPSGGGCNHRVVQLPQNSSYLPHMPCCQPDAHHRVQCGEISSQHSVPLPTDHNSTVQVPQAQYHCGSAYTSPASLQPSTEHTSCTIQNEILKNAWGSGTYDDPNSRKVCQYENLLPNNGQPPPKALQPTVNDDSKYTYENNIQFSPDYDRERHHVISRSKEQPTGLQSVERGPTQGGRNYYESQSLNRRKKVENNQTTSKSIQSLNNCSSVERSSKSTYRSRLSSAGNASTVTAASNRSLASENTLTSSTTKPQVESPPLHVSAPKSQGSRAEHHPSLSHVHTSTSAHSAKSTSQGASSISKWRLFHSTPKPQLVKPNQLVWPIKRNKLNKYIYKRKTKLLNCKMNLDVTSNQVSVQGSSPKISIQIHPFGAEEDCNKCVTMKVSIDFPRKCQLHSETEIEFQVRARELKNDVSVSSEVELSPLQRRREVITRNFFYIKGFISHEALKNSHCDYVEVIVSVKLKQ